MIEWLKRWWRRGEYQHEFGGRYTPPTTDAAAIMKAHIKKQRADTYGAAARHLERMILISVRRGPNRVRIMKAFEALEKAFREYDSER